MLLSRSTFLLNARGRSFGRSLACARVFTNGNYVWVKLWLCYKCLGKIPGLICRLIYNTRAILDCGMVCLRALKIAMFHAYIFAHYTHIDADERAYHRGSIGFIYFIHSSAAIAALIKKYCAHFSSRAPCFSLQNHFHCSQRIDEIFETEKWTTLYGFDCLIADSYSQMAMRWPHTQTAKLIENR